MKHICSHHCKRSTQAVQRGRDQYQCHRNFGGKPFWSPSSNHLSSKINSIQWSPTWSQQRFTRQGRKRYLAEFRDLQVLLLHQCWVLSFWRTGVLSLFIVNWFSFFSCQKCVMKFASWTYDGFQVEGSCNWTCSRSGPGRYVLKIHFSLNRAWKWFNSKQNPKYSFKKYSFNWVREILYNYLFKRLWGKSFKIKKRPKNYSPRIWLDTQKIVGIIRNSFSSWGSW